MVFDIDGTLSPEVSWLALTRDLGAPVEDHVQIYNDYRQGNIDYQVAKTRLLLLWQATGNTIKSFFADLFESLPLDPAAKHIAQV